MPSEETARVVTALADRGYQADREAVTLLARATDRQQAVDRVVETAPDDALVISAEHVRATLDAGSSNGTDFTRPTPDDPPVSGAERAPPPDTHTETPVETGGNATATTGENGETGGTAPNRDSNRSTDSTNSTVRDGSRHDDSAPGDGSTTGDNSATRDDPTGRAESARSAEPGSRNRSRGRDGSVQLEVSGDIQSTGTGEYDDFVAVFRDRYERLSELLRGRVTHRPAAAIADLSDGSEAAMVGMVADRYSTASDHLRFELEDTSGTYPCLVMNDRPFAEQARRICHDEVIAVEGRVLKDDGDDEGILLVEELHVPDVPHTHSPSTADRQVRAALVSDIHVGSEEFLPDAWGRFAGWLHSEDAADIEYLLIAGDMVEGVGVYPGQDEELDIVDVYDQYEQFSEHLKDVPGDMEIVMIPGNHDAVRLAEPQPAFDENLRDIMSAHDATISANPSTVTVEGVSVLMYHGVSLDEIIAELPDASYEQPAEAMTRLLEKRHLAPQYGGQVRIAPEEEDHLVIDEVPDIFHAGHVHKFGYTRHRGVLTVNSSCWQSQTDFQASVNLDPDVAYAPVVDLQTLDLGYAQFV